MAVPSSYAAFGRRKGFPRFDLEPARFADLAGFDGDDCLAAFDAFMSSARALAEGLPPTRPALATASAFISFCRAALQQPRPLSGAQAREFFETHFRPWRISPADSAPGTSNGFLTGYYEPEVAGSLRKTADFTAPILARPDDLITLVPGETAPGIHPRFSAVRLTTGGGFEIYPARAAIEMGEIAHHSQPVVWLRDAVEVFLIQVQGSARVRLANSRVIRLGYAGRNGHPYTSIGRNLIERGEIPEAEMSLARLKQWIRQAGQSDGEAGQQLMQLNHSYVFFKIEETLSPGQGPIGAAGVPLIPLRSVAVDRNLWHYGLPFWIEAELPWQQGGPVPFRRIMVAHDTGSAILGPARADLFFGSGDEAGRMAGNIRHPANVHVLLPCEPGN